MELQKQIMYKCVSHSIAENFKNELSVDTVDIRH